MWYEALRNIQNLAQTVIENCEKSDDVKVAVPSRERAKGGCISLVSGTGLSHRMYTSYGEEQ